MTTITDIAPAPGQIWEPIAGEGLFHYLIEAIDGERVRLRSCDAFGLPRRDVEFPNGCVRLLSQFTRRTPPPDYVFSGYAR